MPIPLRKVREATRVALENESITRERVDRLERWATVRDEQASGWLVQTSTFLGRLRWLLTGRD